MNGVWGWGKVREVGGGKEGRTWIGIKNKKKRFFFLKMSVLNFPVRLCCLEVPDKDTDKDRGDQRSLINLAT